MAYFGKSLSKVERHYCVTRRELLAIVKAVRHFHHYLYGVQFTIRTDHGALTWLTNFKNPEGQLARWLEILGTYNYTIKYRAGLKHNNADGLSRRPCENCNHCDRKDKVCEKDPSDTEECPKTRAIRQTEPDGVEYTVTATNWVNAMTLPQLKAAQDKDPNISIVTQWLKNGVKPTWQDISHLNKIPKAYWVQWDRLILKEGIVYRKWVNTSTNEESLLYILPDCFKKQVLEMLHDDPLSGHMGIKRTIARVRHKFYRVG